MGLGIVAIAQDAIAALGTPTTFVQVTGQQLTAAAGTITQINTGSVQLTGVQATANTGQIQVDPDIEVTGLGMTTSIGPFSIRADVVTEVVQGETISVSTGTLSITSSPIVSLNGINMNVSTGTVDAVIVADTTTNNMNMSTG